MKNGEMTVKDAVDKIVELTPIKLILSNAVNKGEMLSDSGIY